VKTAEVPFFASELRFEGALNLHADEVPVIFDNATRLGQREIALTQSTASGLLKPGVRGLPVAVCL